MARRPGLRELSDAAGVSLATVDRALNGRETVRAETVARISASLRDEVAKVEAQEYDREPAGGARAA